MNKEEPYREQAERLKKRIEKINERNERLEESDELPPREQLHRQKHTKTKWKVKYPVIRLLVLIFILLPIIIFSVISYLDGKKIEAPAKTSGKSVETLNLEKSIPEKGKKSNAPVSQKTEQGTSEEPSQGSQNTNSEMQAAPPAAPPAPNIQGPSTDKGSSNGQAGTQNGQNTKTPSQTTGKGQAAAENIVYHTVKQQETLYSIAMEYYHSQSGIKIIQKANHLVNNEVYAGQVLKIPLN